MGCGVKDMMERKQSIHVWTNMVFHFNFYSHKYVSKWGLERDVFPPHKSNGLYVPDNVWVSNGYDGLSLNGTVCLDQFTVLQRTMRSQTIFKIGTQSELKEGH